MLEPIAKFEFKRVDRWARGCSEKQSFRWSGGGGGGGTLLIIPSLARAVNQKRSCKHMSPGRRSPNAKALPLTCWPNSPLMVDPVRRRPVSRLRSIRVSSRFRNVCPSTERDIFRDFVDSQDDTSESCTMQARKTNICHLSNHSSDQYWINWINVRWCF